MNKQKIKSKGIDIDFINRATEKIPILKEIANMTSSIELTRIPTLRAEQLILNSEGINVLCRIGHYIIQDN